MSVRFNCWAVKSTANLSPPGQLVKVAVKSPASASASVLAPAAPASVLASTTCRPRKLPVRLPVASDSKSKYKSANLTGGSTPVASLNVMLTASIPILRIASPVADAPDAPVTSARPSSGAVTPIIFGRFQPFAVFTRSRSRPRNTSFSGCPVSSVARPNSNSADGICSVLSCSCIWTS